MKRNNFRTFLKNSRFKNKKFSDLDSIDILEFVSEFENKFKIKVSECMVGKIVIIDAIWMN